MRKIDFKGKTYNQAPFSHRVALWAAAIAFCGFVVMMFSIALQSGASLPFATVSTLFLPDGAGEREETSLLSYIAKSGQQILSPAFFPSLVWENFTQGGKVLSVSGDGKDAVSRDLELKLCEDVFLEDISAPDGSLPVMKTTLYASESFIRIGGVYINNETEKKINVTPSLIELEKNSFEPQVLIYHTHGTEAYNPGYSFYGGGVYEVNTTDTSQNVVHIGGIIAAILESNGIKVIHLTEMFDADGYNDAYDKSRAAAQKVLDEYPSIKIVIDVHRDTVIQKDGTKLRTVVSGENGDIAQLMILIGAGRSGYPVPLWENNLSFSIGLASAVNEKNDSVMRPIMLRNTHYNQQLSVGSLLLEVGTCGNSLAEAERAALLFAETLADVCVK